MSETNDSTKHVPGEMEIQLFTAYWTAYFGGDQFPRQLPTVNQMAEEVGIVKSATWRRIDNACKAGLMTRGSSDSKRSSFSFTEDGLRVCVDAKIIEIHEVNGERVVTRGAEFTPA